MSYSVSVTRSGGGAVAVDRTQGAVKVVQPNNIGTLVSVAQGAAGDAADDAAAAAASALAASGSASAAASSATDAQTAQTAAELAETHAETAETNAETAQGLAEAAQAAAEAAQGAAEAAQVAAETAETNAETAETAAETAQGLAEAAQAAAEAAAASITLPLPVASGGTEATDATGARANLGLGTMATQAASAVAITGGTAVFDATSGLAVRDTDSSHKMFIQAGSNITADRIFTVSTGDANRTLNLALGSLTVGGTSTINGTFAGSSSGTNTGDQTITLTGDVTGTGTGSFAATIAADAVTNAKLADMAALTVKANATNGAANPTDVAAGTTGHVFRRSGTALAFGTLEAGAFATAPGIVTPAMLDNGSARSVLGVTGNSAAARADMQATAYQVLRGNSAGTAVAFGAIDLSQSAAATGVLQAASYPATTGDVTSVAGALATTIANDAVTNAKMANMAQSTIKGRAASAGTGDPTDLSAAQVKTILGVSPPTIRVITASGTYTPTTGATLAIVEVVGGGGGGGGADVSTSSDWTASGGGGGGGYSRKLITLSGTYSVTIGAAGTTGSNTGGNGGTGGTTTFGTGPLLQATGGTGGSGSAAGGDPGASGGAGGVGSSGDFNAEGQGGSPGISASSPGAISGAGGASMLGGGGRGQYRNSSSSGVLAGATGGNYGGGGGGAVNIKTTAGTTGGLGAAGVVIVTEFYL